MGRAIFARTSAATWWPLPWGKEEPPRVPRAALRERVRPSSLDCETIAEIPVCYDEREGFMHHKFLVVDGKAVWTGSTNMTWNAFARNNENSLLLPSPTLAQGYAREFAALFGGAKEGLGQPVAFALAEPGVEGTAFFSPKGGKEAREALLARLREAREEVLVAAFVLTDREAVASLLEAHRRGCGCRSSWKPATWGTAGRRGCYRPGSPCARTATPTPCTTRSWWWTAPG